MHSLLIRSYLYRRPDPFRTARDLGLVSPGCPGGSGSSQGCSSAWLPAARSRARLMVFKSIRGSRATTAVTWLFSSRGWARQARSSRVYPALGPLVAAVLSPLSAWSARSGSYAYPDGYACCSGQLDGMAAAGAVIPDEGGTTVRAERDYLRIAAVACGSPVAAPAGGVRLDLVTGGAGRVGGGDGVGSARARAVHQQYAFGVPVEDHRQGLAQWPARRPRYGCR